MYGEEIFNYINSQQKNAPTHLLEALRKAKLAGLAPNQLKEEYKIQWLLNQAYLDEVRSWQLPDNLKGTLLKGMHLLSNEIYDHPGQRFMGDVDILVHKTALENWGLFLEDQGYRDMTKDSWEANNFKRMYLKTSGTLELVIELHTRLFYQEEKDFSWETVNHPKLSSFSVLSPEDLFIHLCGHLAYQHTFISLHWLYDIALVVKHYELNWSVIKERASKAQVLRSCQLILKLMKDYFFIKDLPDLGLSPLVSYSCEKLITKDFLTDPNSYPRRYYLIKHITKDHISQALAYDLNWFKAKGLDRIK